MTERCQHVIQPGEHGEVGEVCERPEASDLHAPLLYGGHRFEPASEPPAEQSIGSDEADRSHIVLDEARPSAGGKECEHPELSWHDQGVIGVPLDLRCADCDESMVVLPADVVGAAHSARRVAADLQDYAERGLGDNWRARVAYTAQSIQRKLAALPTEGGE